MKSKGRSEGDLTDEQSIAILAEALAHLNQSSNERFDPFEMYAQQLRSKIFSHPEVFKARCLQGYRNLVKEMGQK